jgi:hypothetical protein
MRAVAISLCLAACCAPAVAQRGNSVISDFQIQSDPLLLMDVTPIASQATKETIVPWGMQFNCTPMCQSTANNFRFRVLDTGVPGQFTLGLMRGVGDSRPVFYSLVRNYDNHPFDVVIEVILIDEKSNGELFEIGRGDVVFSRYDCSRTKTFDVIVPTPSNFRASDPALYPKPVLIAKRVVLKARWRQRDNKSCDGQ